MCIFKVGDRVRLASDTEGNVPMTVNGYMKDEARYQDAISIGEFPEDDKKKVQCVWRDHEDTPHKEYYHEDALVLCE